MTTDTAPLTAEDFARGIVDMRFSDVMRVVDAINVANGYTSGKRSRGKVDGMTLLSAAQAILDPGKQDKAPAPKARTAPPAEKPAAKEPA